MNQVNRNTVVPMLFNDWSATRILQGNKTATRRLGTLDKDGNLVRDNKHLPGDYLYGREKHGYKNVDSEEDFNPDKWETIYFAGLDPNHWCYDLKKDLHHGEKPFWRPGLFLLKKFARILLKVTDVDYEPLLDLTEADAIAEGCTSENPIEEYFRVWEDINGIGSVAKNPIVKVISFDIVSTTPEETQRILTELER